MSSSDGSFRVGRVKVYRRGQVWYLDYHEQGRRHRPRVGAVRQDAKRLAATVNAQLENGEPAATSFESLTLPELRRRWLEHHEHVRRSSLATISRYRTATDHLLRFVDEVKPVKRADQFGDRHAEEFVRYLRQLEVAPNGHANTAKRKLRGKGLKYVLEACRTLFNFAIKRRHLPPYTDNPFTVIEIDRVPVEDDRVMVMPNDEQQLALLEAGDAWAQSIFVTLMLTGMRPGELVHLLVSDVDLEEGWLRVRSKPQLGWRTKTRNERSIPLVSELHEMLKRMIGERSSGPVFLRHRYMEETPPLIDRDETALAKEVQRWVKDHEQELGRSLDRTEHAAVCRTVWRDMGATKTDRIGNVFRRAARSARLTELPTPKTLRHLFATALQSANVDPLIRNQLMGHAPASGGIPVAGLGMTAVYTHTQPAVMRCELERALEEHPARSIAAQCCTGNAAPTLKISKKGAI